MQDAFDPRTWPASRLVARISQLEAELRDLKQAHALSKLPTEVAEKKRAKLAKQKDKSERQIDPSLHSTRFIALKFAYLGQRYNGLEHHVNNTTPLPTIEEELWKALMKTRLIMPTGEAKEGVVTWEGCEYAKCGRTDKGVSAFGQVVSLRVRSSKPKPVTRKNEQPEQLTRGNEEMSQNEISAELDASEEDVETEKPWDPIKDELPYIAALNRVLPEDIRVLAWCPDPPENFNARFSCDERWYRYFFTNPAFAPVPGQRGISKTAGGKPLREGWLDIEAMQDAAKRLEGLNDFRNFCKIDPVKQISNFERRISHASITEVDQTRHPAGYAGAKGFANNDEPLTQSTGASDHVRSVDFDVPRLYTFNVRGSAFLWHQVRMMVAILFAVGQGLEHPSIVSELLDVKTNPTRPRYEMASDAPLVLWDCLFSTADEAGNKVPLPWIYASEEGNKDVIRSGSDVNSGDGKFGRGSLTDALWTLWRRRKIDEILAGSLLDRMAEMGPREPIWGDNPGSTRTTRIFEGGNEARAIGQYRSIMQKERLEHYEIVNARYRERKGLDTTPRGQKKSEAAESS